MTKARHPAPIFMHSWYLIITQKNYMRPCSVCTLMICLVLMMEACNKGTNPPPNPPPPPPPHGSNAPTISGISPDSGARNVQVTITGTNYGTDTSKIKVSFNGVAAILKSASATQIVTLVPAKAGKGPVIVTVDGQSVQGPIFNYLTSVWVTTIAGNGQSGFADGSGSAATFYSPRGITVDSSGNVYVADWGN